MTPSDLTMHRDAMGASQAELATALDIGTSSLCRYETGARPIPRAVTLAVLYLRTIHWRPQPAGAATQEASQ